jgi:hypothetical protein
MVHPIESLPADVVEAWKSGNKIEAIKRLREATHMGLAEAKAAIDSLDREPGATPRVSMARARTASPPTLPEMLKALQESGALPPDVMEAWQRGAKLEALKRFAAAAKEGRIQANVKMKMNVNERESKAATLGPRRTFPRFAKPAERSVRAEGLSPGEVPRSGNGAAGALVLIAVIVIAIVVYVRFG